MADLTRAQREDLPSTVARSDDHAQATGAEIDESARETYEEGERASQTGLAERDMAERDTWQT